LGNLCTSSLLVIPAKAGIHFDLRAQDQHGSRLDQPSAVENRRDDSVFKGSLGYAKDG
jgi:hypothetical protein